MAYENTIKKFLGQGVASSRPASLNLEPGAVGMYIATDTGVRSYWYSGAWHDASETAGTPAPSIQTLTSAATITPVATNDKVVVTGLTTNTTIADPTGVAAEGQGFVIDIYAAAVYTVGFGTAYAGMDAALTGISTTANKLLKIGVEYSSATGKWMVYKPSVQA